MIKALLFLMDSLAGFLTGLLLLRFLMQLFRVSFANALGRLVVQLTNWLVTPLRRVLPGVFGLDLASLLPALLCQALVVTALIDLQGSLAVMEPASLVLLILGQALRATLRMAIYLMIGALIAQAVLSWVNPFSPLAPVFYALARPVLAPFQKRVPPLGGMDITPLVALIVIQLLLIAPVSALERYALGLVR